MKIIAADDEILQLNKLERAIAKAVPTAEITAFSDSTELLNQIKRGSTAGADVAFLDIEMGAVSGIRIAKKLQAVNPKINIVFVTGFLEYAPDAFELRASGYVSKPATEQKIRAEIDNESERLCFQACNRAEDTRGDRQPALSHAQAAKRKDNPSAVLRLV